MSTDNTFQITETLSRLSDTQSEFQCLLLPYQNMCRIYLFFSKHIEAGWSSLLQQKQKFNTESGVEMFNHQFQVFKTLLNNVKEDSFKLTTLTQKLQAKTAQMSSAIKFVKPVLKQIRHKKRALGKEEKRVHEKLIKLEKMKFEFEKKEHLNRTRQQLEFSDGSASCILLEERLCFCESDKENIEPANGPLFRKNFLTNRDGQEDLSLSSVSDAQDLLDLKRIELDEYMAVEREITERTLGKIYNILGTFSREKIVSFCRQVTKYLGGEKVQFTPQESQQNGENSNGAIVNQEEHKMNAKRQLYKQEEGSPKQEEQRPTTNQLLAPTQCNEDFQIFSIAQESEINEIETVLSGSESDKEESAMEASEYTGERHGFLRKGEGMLSCSYLKGSNRSLSSGMTGSYVSE